tara:strand:- start:102 stop:731 length:630 start_codon:yes stop_codon:yes gene_type:complete
MAITKLKALGVTDGTLTNTQINASAAIAKSKLGALDIVNADINASAAIARTKFAVPVCVYANSTTNNGGFAAGAWEAVEFANEVIDTNNAFNGQEGTNANNGGVFTCPVAGRYQIHAGSVAESASGGMANMGLQLVKNTTGNAANGGTRIDGTESNFVANSGSITVVSGNVLAIADLAVGNKVWLQAYANWHSGSWVAGAGHFSVMQIA